MHEQTERMLANLARSLKALPVEPLEVELVRTDLGWARVRWYRRPFRQEDLARFLGVGTSTVRRWEKGEAASIGRPPLLLVALVRLQRAGKLRTLSEHLEGAPNPNSSGPWTFWAAAFGMLSDIDNVLP